MRIFLSYASQDRSAAEPINRALLDQGHDVFFDRDDLAPGEEYHIQIRNAIERSELFVFLISDDALDTGSYTLNELAMAERVITRASGRLLPVMLRPTSFDRIPEFVKSVTLLQSPGNITAATADAVHRLAQKRQRALWGKIAGGVTVVALLAIGAWSLRGNVKQTATLPADSSAATTSTTATGAGSNAPAASIDGAPESLVPAGAFVMGDDEHAPMREVYVDSFYIDTYEVTTSRYAKFLAATGGIAPPDQWETLEPTKHANLPVIGVSWTDARAYCAWAGRRMPTDAEWEKAARGTDQRLYPWGSVSPGIDRANFGNASPSAYDGGLSDVGSHAAGRSPYGVEDLAGNANEWVADWYAESFPRSDVRNPVGPESGPGRVVRGGGRYEPPERLLSARRYYAAPDGRQDDLGFRCARSVRAR